MKQVKIKLDVGDIKSFYHKITTLIGDIDLIQGNYSVDAKSLLGIYSLSLSSAIVVRFYSEDGLEQQRFLSAMEEYKCEE